MKRSTSWVRHEPSCMPSCLEPYLIPHKILISPLGVRSFMMVEDGLTADTRTPANRSLYDLSVYTYSP